MSDDVPSAPPLTRDEMRRFAEHNQEFVARIRLLVTRHKSLVKLSEETKVPYEWLRTFVRDGGAQYDIGRLSAVYLACVDPHGDL